MAARRAARYFVQREGLRPPVDVESLLAAHVFRVERVDWPVSGVDAVTHGLGTNRVSVFVRATDNLLRERFTMAHELGHLILPWHLPRASCQVGSAQLDDESTLENEADIFASCLLAPDAWLTELYNRHEGDMSLILGALNAVEISTPAALLAMRRHFLAGWAFHRSRGNEWFVTPGTGLTPRGLPTADVQAAATAWGTASLNAEKVRWYRFSEVIAELPARAPGDLRTPHRILVDALAAASTSEAPITLAQRLNGMFAGALQEGAGRPAGETYAAMALRISQSEHAGLLDVVGVRLWLAERCRAVETKTVKRRGQSATGSREGDR